RVGPSLASRATKPRRSGACSSASNRRRWRARAPFASCNNSPRPTLDGASMSELASRQYDVIVVGAGPNGLAAAIACARAGLGTLVVEASDSAGGGARSAPLTLPGFVHDVCSTVHPLALASPFFKTLALERFGLSWVDSPAPLAHVLSNDEVIT